MEKYTVFKYCKATKTVLPIHEARALDSDADGSVRLASIAHGFIQDEMKATQHPVDGKYYTSQAKFREVTKSHGYEEVGNAYENGYNPEREAEKDYKNHIKGVNTEWKRRLMES